MQAHNGMLSEDLAQTACAAFHTAMSLQHEWEHSDQDGWESVARKAINMMSVDGDNEATELAISAKQTAEILHFQFSITGRPEHEIPAFAELPLKSRLAWEAVGRHLFNCLTSDGSIAISEFENWQPWLERQLAVRNEGVLV
jgi:hypothetical protein